SAWRGRLHRARAGPGRLARARGAETTRQPAAAGSRPGYAGPGRADAGPGVRAEPRGAAHAAARSALGHDDCPAPAVVSTPAGDDRHRAAGAQGGPAGPVDREAD